MQLLRDPAFLAVLLLVTGVNATPTRTPSPASVPLPEQPGRGSPPPLGSKGVITDDVGDTHAFYGSNKQSGIPHHAAHVASNQAQFPENKGLFPVNNDSPAAKKKLREDIIGNKPSEPGSSRDHKPPNVQKLPGTTQERKDRSTTKNLPTSESDKEFRLLGTANSKANARGSTGNIAIHPHIDPNDSRPSTRNSLNSLPPDQRPSKIPQPKKNTGPAPNPSPRRTRSHGPPTQPGPSTGGQNRPSTPPAGGQQIQAPGFASGTPQRHFTQQPPAAPRPQGGAAPGTPNTPTPAPRNQGSTSTPSKLPILGGKKKPGKRDLDDVIFEILARRELIRRSWDLDYEFEDPYLW